MKSIFITRNDDSFDSIQWAFEVHIKQVDTQVFNSAILHGNEDSPESIHFYATDNPRYDDAAIAVWTPASGLQEIRN